MEKMELIKITTKEDGTKLVSARELHEGLGIKTRFNDWFKRMCEYGFEENMDFIAITQKRVTAQGNEVTYIDYAIKLDMAKEISMLQRNELGKKYRQYFIECEKQLKEVIPQLSPKELLQLKILNGSDVERAGAMIEYEKVLTQPLIAENTHKGEVIKGLTEDITLAEKRQRISQIIRHGSKNYKDRYNLLYSEFNKKYHVDTATRLKNAIERKEVKKSMNRMGYICETMNKTAELYELACKLFENDVESLMQEMWNKIAS